MTNDKIQQLTHGLQTAFIDQTITSNLPISHSLYPTIIKKDEK